MRARELRTVTDTGHTNQSLLNGLWTELDYLYSLLGLYCFFRELLQDGSRSALWIFLILDLLDYFTGFNMTLEELVGPSNSDKK